MPLLPVGAPTLGYNHTILGYNSLFTIDANWCLSIGSGIFATFAAEAASKSKVKARIFAAEVSSGMIYEDGRV